MNPDTVRYEAAAIRARTDAPFNLNFFCHVPDVPDAARESAWRSRLAPYYAELGLDPSAPIAMAQRSPFDAAMLAAVAELPRGDRWSEMARLALRDDLYGALRGLTIEVLNFTDPAEPATQKIGDWASHNARRLERVGALLGEILDPADGTSPIANDESRLSVATRALRSLLRHVG